MSPAIRKQPLKRKPSPPPSPPPSLSGKKPKQITDHRSSIVSFQKQKLSKLSALLSMQQLIVTLDEAVAQKAENLSTTVPAHQSAIEAVFGDRLDGPLMGPVEPNWEALIHACCLIVGKETRERCQADCIQGWIQYEIACRLASKPDDDFSHIDRLISPARLCHLIRLLEIRPDSPEAHQQRVNRCLVVALFAVLYPTKERVELMEELPEFIFDEIRALAFPDDPKLPSPSIDGARYALLTLILLCVDTMQTSSEPCVNALDSRRLLFGNRDVRQAIKRICRMTPDVHEQPNRKFPPLNHQSISWSRRLTARAQDVVDFVDILWDMDFENPLNQTLFYPLRSHCIFRTPAGIANISHGTWLFGGHYGWTSYQMTRPMSEDRDYYVEIRLNTIGSIRIGIAERHGQIRDQTGDITRDAQHYATIIDPYEHRWWMRSKHIENKTLKANEAQAKGSAVNDDLKYVEGDVLGFTVRHMDHRRRMFFITLYDGSGHDGSLKRAYTYVEDRYDRFSSIQKYLTISVGACQHVRVLYRRPEWRFYSDEDVVEFEVPIVGPPCMKVSQKVSGGLGPAPRADEEEEYDGSEEPIANEESSRPTAAPPTTTLSPEPGIRLLEVKQEIQDTMTPNMAPNSVHHCPHIQRQIVKCEMCAQKQQPNQGAMSHVAVTPTISTIHGPQSMGVQVGVYQGDSSHSSQIIISFPAHLPGWSGQQQAPSHQAP